MSVRALAGLLAAALAAVAAGGCGRQGGSSSPSLTVSAAASLQKPLTAYGREFGRAQARLSFGGSDTLAAQIRQGGRPDVFAAANTRLPAQLFAQGLVERPRTFARNRVVLAVPAKATRVASLRDLERPGVTIAIGSPSVPVGAYTRASLDRLPDADRRSIMANVRSEEPDVAGIVGKLTQRAVDAGFVYLSDVRASAGRLRAVALPPATQPAIAYAAAVVKGARHPSVARAFVEGLVSGAGQRKLEAAGFEPPALR